jgi:hypothetical protein
MAVNTHIDGLSTHELLRVISNSRLSGVLTFVDRLRTGRIVFTWGRVTHASTDGQDRLGDVLVREGVISEKDLEAALRAQRGNRKPRPLGTILSSLGFAETSEIQKALRQQMKDALYELLEWENCLAHLQVDIGAALASVRLNVSLDTQALLLEAARRRDETIRPAQTGFNPPVGEEGSKPVGTPPKTPDPAEASQPHEDEQTVFDQWEVLNPASTDTKNSAGTDNVIDPDELTPPVHA